MATQLIVARELDFRDPHAHERLHPCGKVARKVRDPRAANVEHVGSIGDLRVVVSRQRRNGALVDVIHELGELVEFSVGSLIQTLEVGSCVWELCRERLGIDC